MGISSILPVSTDKEVFLVKKITAEFSDGTSTGIAVEWKDSDEPVEVILERKEFASGKTKRAFKVSLSATGGLISLIMLSYDSKMDLVPFTLQNATMMWALSASHRAWRI